MTRAAAFAVVWAAVLAAALAPAAVASAAPARPGEELRLTGKVWNRTIVGTGVYVRGRDTVQLPNAYQDHQLNLGLSLRLYPGVTLTVDGVPVGVAAYGGVVRPYFGGAAGGVHVLLWDGPVQLGVAARIGGRPDVETLAAPTVDGVDVVIVPVVGSFVGGAAGTLLWPLRFGWLSLRVGGEAYSQRDLAPAVFAAAQLGWRAGRSFELSLQVQWWHAIEDDPPVNALGSGNTRYLGFDLDATWWFESWGPFFGVGGVAYAHQNAATPSLRLGVQFR